MKSERAGPHSNVYLSGWCTRCAASINLDRYVVASFRKETGNRVELRRELNRFVHLNYAIRGCIIQGTLKMEDENGWKRLMKHLLARLAQAGSADL